MAGEAHFEIYPRKDNLFGWRLKSANGEIVAQSEGYDSAYNAERGAADAAQAARRATKHHPEAGAISIDARQVDS
jgi:uncharacterized protein YegP (UPF0339 family)